MPLKGAALLVLFLAVGCSKAGAPRASRLVDAGPASALPVVETGESDDSRVWSTRSADTHAHLTQTLSLGGQCHLQCDLEGTLKWEATADCLGRGDERRFVGNDCERAVIIDPAPSRGDWRKAVVMRVYRRQKLAYQVLGPGVVPDEAKVRGQRSWARGCFGVPGEPPRYSADGTAVELTTVEGKPQRVPLSDP